MPEISITIDAIIFESLVKRKLNNPINEEYLLSLLRTSFQKGIAIFIKEADDFIYKLR